MAKDMGPFRDSKAPSWLFWPRADVPTETPSHIGPNSKDESVFALFNLSFPFSILVYIQIQIRM
jgi:hypothetical protein